MPSGHPQHGLGQLVDLLYESMLDAAVWTRFLQGLCETIGAESAQLVSVAPINAQGFWIGYRIDPAAVDAYERYYAARSPWRAAYPSLAPGTCAVVRGEKLARDDRLLASEFYNDFLRPNGQRWMCAALLRAETAQAPSYGLYAYRGPRARPFEPGADELLARLGSHLLRIERLAAAASAWHQSGPDGVLAAVFFLTARGRLLQANAPGERMIVDRVVHPGEHSLAFASDSATRWLRSRFAIAARTREVGGIHRHVESVSASERLELRLAALDAAARSPITRAASWLLTVRRVITAVDDAALARRAHERFHWTRAEFDAVRRLAEGERIDAIARARDCAVETVRSHVKSAKRKAGVSRQMDLVRLVHQMRHASGVD